MSTPGSITETGVTTDDAGRLTTELVCIKCAYNLRTMHLDAACPECGTAVGRSVEGNRLRYCDPTWLKQIWEGLNCFGLAVVATMVFAVVVMVGDQNTPLLWIALPQATMIGLAIYGFIKATKPDPAHIDREWWCSMRRLARLAWLAALSLALALTAIFILGNTFSPGGIWMARATNGLFAVGTLIALAAGVVALLMHAAMLASRLPDLPLTVAVVLVNLCLIALAGFGLVLTLDPLWDFLSDPLLYGYGATRLRWQLMDALPYPMLGLAGLMVLLLAWYWWALSRAARHAWATWARRRGEGD
ncbi:MAG: hypothetical protein WDZ31_12105 [Phycisphaeraceae bacterium]